MEAEYRLRWVALVARSGVSLNALRVATHIATIQDDVISQSQVAVVLGLSRSRMPDAFRQLEAAGLLKRMGWRRWVLCTKETRPMTAEPNPEHDIFGPLPPKYKQRPADDADMWRADVAYKPWAIALRKVAKIGQWNWRKWERLNEMVGGDYAHLCKIVETVPAGQRWPDVVEEVLVKALKTFDHPDAIDV